MGDSLRRERKPLLIFTQTDWCKFCKMQEHITFMDNALVQELNKRFYCLRLHGESKAKISFLGKIYCYQLNGYHELAEMLARANGEVTFPTTVVFLDNPQVLIRYSGYIGPEESRSFLKSYIAKKTDERGNSQNE
ncbi:thioredoxin family protein [uncultured Pontibacter sp.]|uniref:thioredoxin fold domain-containing protein n=1 Tax=uncultured Pontibacter sp. TaxID=453356 RepID=UPI00344B2EEC